MSVKCMARVWDYSQAKGSQLLLLLAIADNARDNGYAFPGIETLARKTRLSERQVMRLIQAVEELGELIVLRHQKSNQNRYVVNVWGPEGGDVACCERCGAVEIQELGITLDERLCGDCRDLAQAEMSGDKMSPLSQVRVVTSGAERGDMGVTREVTPMSPEPSTTIITTSDDVVSLLTAFGVPMTDVAKVQEKGRSEAEVRSCIQAVEGRDDIDYPVPYLLAWLLSDSAAPRGSSRLMVTSPKRQPSTYYNAC